MQVEPICFFNVLLFFNVLGGLQAQQLFTRLQLPRNNDDVVRAQYATSAGLRFAFFVMQSAIRNRLTSGSSINFAAIAQVGVSFLFFSFFLSLSRSSWREEVNEREGAC